MVANFFFWGDCVNKGDVKYKQWLNQYDIIQFHLLSYVLEPITYIWKNGPFPIIFKKFLKYNLGKKISRVGWYKNSA